jgi:hypothetical protein
MHKRLLFFLFLLASLQTKAEDSKIRYSASFGSNSFLFNKGILDPNMTFIAYGVNPLKNFIIGAKAEKSFTDKKALSLGLFYSKSSLQYLYNDRLGWSVGPGGIINHKGYIHYSQIIFNSLGKYSMFKWLNLEYGLSHSIKLKNTFDNKEIGTYISWTDTLGNSKMKTYSLAYSLGIEFVLNKHLSFEILHNRGINNSVNLENTLYSRPYAQYPQKLIYTSFALNYRFK